jgi:transcriptional regulator with XRE-family HTH domain
MTKRPPLETDRPFAKALSELKHERGLSFRGLHHATREADPSRVGLSAGHLSRLRSGTDRPSPAAIAVIAAALEIAPRYFAEYRLAQARALFDERAPGGLRAALGNLQSIADRLPGAPEVNGERRRARSRAA